MASTYNEILERARRFCAYRERASTEVIRKLKAWNTSPGQTDAIVAELKKENFLDDRRFAEAFVRGKFGIKKWGRLRIKVELRRKGIQEQLISNALAAIDEDDYEAVLRSVIEKKAESLENPQSAAAKQKIIRHALSKGFETDLIMKNMP